MPRRIVPFLALLALAPLPAASGDDPAPGRPVLKPADVFELETAADPQLSPDGRTVAYVRGSFDMKADRKKSRLWVVGADGAGHRPLADGTGNERSPRWSPDGGRVVYVSDAGGRAELHGLWADTGRTARLTHLPAAVSGPAAPAWSPDGKWVAFSAFVEEQRKPFIDMPARPEGATWADPPKVITELVYRHDGAGYRKPGHRHLFVVPADGGAARQVTTGAFDHLVAEGPEEPAWLPDGTAVVLAARRFPDADRHPLESDLYEVAIADGAVKRLTDRRGPDSSPVVSPDGKLIAFLGFDDGKVAYQRTRLYVMNRDGTGRRELVPELDRDLSAPTWAADGKGVYVQYPERGDITVGLVPLTGSPGLVAAGVGGVDIGRPYSRGQFSAAGGAVAFTQARPDRPADIAVTAAGGKTARRITALNEGLLAHRSLGAVEEVWYASAKDARKVQGWVVKPPGFDPKKKYPLVLEIHGGPYADYGPSFAVELQLYAAAGYVVLYTNPRGSTGYGEGFAQLINGAYPGDDYDDLMYGVDHVLKQGYVDEKNLFVTGGSGGGVLSAWIIGKTDRFRAAVVAKPVVNWESGALTMDMTGYFAPYWMGGLPWERPEEYRRRSPLSLVGNVKTPTMLLTGEDDHRTPMSESEQFYAALKLRGVEAALVRFPGASHAIVDRPSRQVAKPLCVLRWFDTHRAR
ncbi:MAG TPA: S9 family peptidase [Urbifossiella sp.]|nr:S9 family peptidase [Urbifossiella sp.]